VVPHVLAASHAGSSRDALLWAGSQGSRLADTGPEAITDEMLDSLFEQFLLLRTARIAHGSVNGDAILVDRTTSTVALLDFRNASSNAQVDRLNRDLAGAVASTALAVGPERTAAAAVRCLSTEVLLGSSNTFAEPARTQSSPTPARQDRLLSEVRALASCRGIH